MRPLPQHWQLASAEVEHEGRRFPLRIWGWSAESAADAAMRAQHRLAAAVDQLTRGRAGFCLLYTSDAADDTASV